MLPRTPVLIITAPCTAHTLMATNFVQFYPYGLDFVRGTHAPLMFALLPCDFDNLLEWPFPETIHLPDCDQLDPHSTRNVTFSPSEKLRFPRPTRDPRPTLTKFNFFPDSKMFSKTENFLLNNALYLEIKFTDPKSATSKPCPSIEPPQSFFYPFNAL